MDKYNWKFDYPSEYRPHWCYTCGTMIEDCFQCHLMYKHKKDVPKHLRIVVGAGKSPKS